MVHVLPNVWPRRWASICQTLGICVLLGSLLRCRIWQDISEDQMVELMDTQYSRWLTRAPVVRQVVRCPLEELTHPDTVSCGAQPSLPIGWATPRLWSGVRGWGGDCSRLLENQDVSLVSVNARVKLSGAILNLTLSLPSKYETLTQCGFNVGPPSATLAQHWNHIGLTLVDAGNPFTAKHD